MKKQIIYCKFVPRLFSAMLDLILLSAIMPLLSKLVINVLVLGLFQDYFFSPEKIALNSHLSMSEIIIDPTMYINMNRTLIFMSVNFSVNIILTSIYFVFFWRKFGATPGKMVMRMKVVNADDFTKPSTYNLIKRFIGYSTIMIGIWSILTNKRNMSLHDKIANTVVIQK